jgi:outer membrane immunogenic protein
MGSDPIRPAFLGIHSVALFVAAIVLCSMGKAGAADRATSPPSAPYSWTGCYAGLNAGKIIGADQNSTSIGGGFLLGNDQFSMPVNQEQVNKSFGMQAQGFTAGGQMGCNKQIGMLVFGVEADIDHAPALGTRINFGPAGPIIGVPNRYQVSSQIVSVDQEDTWYSTVRGRIGLAPIPTLLIYATGGAAFAPVKSSASVTFGADKYYLNNSVFAASNASNRAGWTIGGGMEWAFLPRWSLKAEYLYLDFGSVDYALSCQYFTCSNSPTVPYAWSARVHTADQVVRIGLNYEMVSPALGADLPAPVMPIATPYTWTGPTIGINGGWSGGQAQAATLSTDDPPGTLGHSAGLAAPTSFVASGPVGGFQLGYNWQLSRNWLIGAETDFDFASIAGRGTSTNVLRSAASILDPLPFISVADETLQWFGTVRGRLGFLPTRNSMIYGTGGFAYGRIDQNATYTYTSRFDPLSSVNGICNPSSVCYAGANNLTATGWAAGGGLEYLLSNNWTVRAEYLHVNFNGANRVDEVVIKRQPGSTPPSTIMANFNGLAFQTVRCALTYKF